MPSVTIVNLPLLALALLSTSITGELTTSPSPVFTYSLISDAGGLNGTANNANNTARGLVKRSHIDASSTQYSNQINTGSGGSIRSNSIPTQTQSQPQSQLANIENILTEQNFSTLLDNELLQNSPFYSNYYLSPYYGMDTSPTSGFMFPPFDQYSYAYGYNQSMDNGKHKINKNGLGRRIGELMSTSAEKATKAFKSFSQLKLFNDIKPSRLLGLANGPHSDQLNLLKFNSTNHANLPVSSLYFPSTPINTWSSFAPPPNTASNLFYQQPVFVRTDDNPPHPQPSAVSPSKPEFIASLGEYFNQKLPLDNNNYHPGNGAPAVGSASTMVPVVQSSTTVYHHFANNNNIQNANNQQDLYAAPQTNFGFRVKAPKEYNEFDNSNEDELSGEQDDTKMANEGANNNNDDGRINNNDNGHSNDNHANHAWPNNFEDYPESSNEIGHDMYPQPPYRQTRPFTFPQRRPQFRHRPMNRRPMAMSEPEDSENWYQTFFGANVKPMKNIRSFTFNGPSISYPAPPPPHQSHHTIMSQAASTQTPNSMTPEIMPPFFRPHDHPMHGSNMIPYMAAPRPTWAYNMFGHPTASSSFYNFRPGAMMQAATSLRPVAVPYYPQSSYYRYRQSPMFNYASPTLPSPTASLSAPMMSPHLSYRFSPVPTPFSPIMPAASSMYPVRIPYMPMHSIPYGIHTSPIYPAMRPAPIVRYRYGPEMTPLSKRSMQITKRAEVAPEWSSRETPPKSVPVKKDTSRTKTTHKSSDLENLATMYNAYQVLQKRMENTDQTSQRENTNQNHSYYYYIGMDNSTESAAVTTSQPDPDSLSVNNRTSMMLRSLKARHVDKKDHEEMEASIKKIAVSHIPKTTTTTTEASFSSFTKMKPKLFSGVNNSGWRPLVKPKNKQN